MCLQLLHTSILNIISDARETTGAGDQNDDPLATQKRSVPLQLLLTLTYLSLSKLGNFENFRNFRHTFAHALKSEIHPFPIMEILAIVRKCFLCGYLVAEG